MIKVRKRDGILVPFSKEKIFGAVGKAYNEYIPKDWYESTDAVKLQERLDFVTDITMEVSKKVSEIKEPCVDVEAIQDIVIKCLKEKNKDVAKIYSDYRKKRTKAREKNSAVMKAIGKISGEDSKALNVKRDNANIDGDSAMGTMLQIGSEASKEYYLSSMVSPDIAQAHIDGDIHIHDLDFYRLTETCCQIDLIKLFEGGFNTGHGYLREPNSIGTATALAAIAIQANQNDQHGGQSIPNFDYAMGKYVKKSFEKNRKHIIDEIAKFHGRASDEQIDEEAWKLTTKDTYQAMEAFIANLNSMHSRAGAQVPFSSINYGLDTSPEGRMVIKQLLLATEDGLGKGETPIFPIQIFRVKEGINLNEGEPNYDLFDLACKVSEKRLFPNFSFVDAPYNLQYYKPGKPETEVAYMGCRTRVIGNVYDTERQITYGRGNLSFTSINLPRLAIRASGNAPYFFKLLDEELELVARQLKERFDVQCQRHPKNYPFLMKQGVWIDSDKLGDNDDITEILKHGTLSIGFIGLAETLTCLTGKHHGESEDSQKLGLQIVKYIRDFCDNKSQQTKMNWTCLATPAEGLSGRFVKIDQQRYGKIPGVTDKKYYTNSFHVPVGYKTTAFHKLEVEGPYHALTNAGHISYIEIDGDPSKNHEAFVKIVKHMAKTGVGYGAINHPVDRCPKCGHQGIIDGCCPECGSDEIERLRRITGYLVGTLDRWNDGKKAEEADRVKHE